MWVFCGGMYRAGSTVQYQITADLVESAGHGKRIGWVPKKEFPLIRERHRGENGLVVLKAHSCTDEMKRELESDNAAGVYIYRDLRDVALSAMRADLTGGSDLGLIQNAVKHYKAWTRQPNVLASKYEDAVASWTGEAERICAHLKLDCDAGMIQRVVERYSVQEQRKRIAEAGKDDYEEGLPHLKHHLLHANHISSRAGAVGDWETELTDAQIRTIEDLAGDWLRENGYPVTPKWKRWLQSLAGC